MQLPKQTARGNPVVLPDGAWQQRQANHHARVDAWLGETDQFARQGKPHPVYDFLFTYYSLRRARLREWHPGAGVCCAGADAQAFLSRKYYARFPDGVGVDADAVIHRRREGMEFIRNLLRKSAERPPFFGCHGLHEWAMVYRESPGTVRHSSIPLRMDSGRLAAFVESMPIACSHYDAFRFFTPSARPLNRLSPSPEGRVEMEQTGCLHANMDLYKWAGKMIPLVPSELLADAFEVALEARKVDMRASPYDLQALGFSPIRIETPEGRLEYENEQRRIRQKAEPVRLAMLSLLNRLLAT